MNIKLGSKEAIFTQVVDAVKENILNGTLKPNDKLPSVRVLANEMSVNPNTVMRAYSILEQEQIIYSLNKKGYYVSENTIDLKLELEKNLKNTIKEMILKNYTIDDIMSIIKEEYYDKNK